MLRKFVDKFIDGVVYHMVGILLQMLGMLIVKLCLRYDWKFILKIISDKKYVVRPIGFQYN